MGVTPQGLAQGMPWVYLALAAALLGTGRGGAGAADAGVRPLR
jgi:hypothetical protein